jgi:uncharacterized membrane protein YbhN (UPF0104 family)
MVHIVGEGKPLHWGLNLSWIRGPRIIVRAFGLQLYWRWRWEHGMRPFEWWFGRILCPQRGHDLHTGAAWARTLLEATGGLLVLAAIAVFFALPSHGGPIGASLLIAGLLLAHTEVLSAS